MKHISVGTQSPPPSKTFYKGAPNAPPPPKILERTDLSVDVNLIAPLSQIIFLCLCVHVCVYLCVVGSACGTDLSVDVCYFC